MFSVGQARTGLVNLPITPRPMSSFIRTVIKNPTLPSGPQIPVACLIDTGNNAPRCLMSARCYEKISAHDQKLNAVDFNVYGAGKKQSLKVLGVPDSPLVLNFTDKHGKRLEYAIHPIVVEDLHLPLILSMNDITHLKADVITSAKVVKMTVKGKIFEFPLGPLRSPRNATLQSNFVMEPRSDHVIEVFIDGLDEEEDVLFKPNQKVMNEYNINIAMSIDKEVNNTIRIAVTNLNHNRLELPYGLNMGNTLGVTNDVFFVSNVDDILKRLNTVRVIPEKNDTKKKHNLPEYREDMDEHEIAWLIWHLLGFHTNRSALTHEQKKKVAVLLTKYRDALHLTDSDIGDFQEFQCNIPTVGEPVRQKLRPMAPHLKKLRDEQVAKWLKNNIIEPCNDSQWASNLVPVVKKPDINEPNKINVRFCVDFRPLNRQTVIQSLPLANLQELLSRLKCYSDTGLWEFYSAMDFFSAYESMHINPEDASKTTFLTDDGGYKFLRMGFGLTMAPAIWHSLVITLNRELVKEDPNLAQEILTYFDDSLFLSKSFEHLLHQLECFLKVIIRLRLRINPKKCSIGQKSINWLGHTINNQGLQPDKSKVETMTSLKSPTTFEECRSFHGLISYFRKFIRNFAAKTANIRKNLSSKNVFQWTQECEKEKNAIIQEQIGRAHV